MRVCNISYHSSFQNKFAAAGGDGPEPDVQAGDAVLVSDYSGRIIAWGVFNPVSMFRVR